MPVNYLEKTQPDQNNSDKITQHVKNLSSTIPADATALHLTGLQIIDKNNATKTAVVFAASLILLLFIRIYTKAGIWVTLSTTAAYLIWVYAIGDGFFQAIGVNLGNLGAFAVVAYSAAAITIANIRGKEFHTIDIIGNSEEVFARLCSFS